MNAPSDSDRWSWSRWIATISLAFGIQAVLVFLFSDRDIAHPALDPEPAKDVFFLGLTSTGFPRKPQLLARDPALLTRVHDQSYTGSLWDHSISLNPDYTAWTEAPRYYLRTQFVAGATLRKRVRTQNLPASIVSRPAPELSGTEGAEAFPAAVSSFQIQGDIASRLPDLSSWPPLPSWQHSNLVRPSVIAVAIDRFGWAQSRVIISNSLPEADAFAQEWVRQAQFEPREPNRIPIDTGLVWGEITFRWATSPPSETPAKPGS